jgi:hypothetical protein
MGNQKLKHWQLVLLGIKKLSKGWVIMVTGVYHEATEEDLQEKFSNHGSAMDLAMALDHRTGYAKVRANIFRI